MKLCVVCLERPVRDSADEAWPMCVACVRSMPISSHGDLVWAAKRARSYERKRAKKTTDGWGTAEHALNRLLDAYPDGEWRGLLHEGGCVGVYTRREDRDGERDCHCDGDDHEDEIQHVLRLTRAKKAKGKK